MHDAAAQRERGLAILTGDSDILAIAREVSTIVRERNLDAAVIGGVAVVLHGHVRTTLDVDLYTTDTDALAAALTDAGFVYDADRREFSKGGVPVHLVTLNELGDPPRRVEDIDAIRTVSLADLISMKLRSGTSDMLRAQDLADVIGLIRHHELRNAFTAQILPGVRADFRRIVKEIESR